MARCARVGCPTGPGLMRATACPRNRHRRRIERRSRMSEQDAPMGRATLHHVNLKTTRLQEMIDWYGTVVGAKPTFQFPAAAWLTNDGANHRIALISSSRLSDDPDKLAHTGMHHMAFEHDSCDELLANFTRLK